MAKNNTLPPKRFKATRKKKNTVALPTKQAEMTLAKKVEKKGKTSKKATGIIKAIKNPKKEQATPHTQLSPEDSPKSKPTAQRPLSPIENSAHPLVIFLLIVIILPLAIYLYQDQKLTRFVQALSQNTTIAKNPEIMMAEDVYDFGTIKQDQHVTHDFIFKNTGSANLIIEKTMTSCGCTAAVVGKKTYAPGEEGTLTVTFSAGKREGQQNKVITLVTNDPINPQKNVSIKGKVEAVTPPSPIATSKS